MECNTHHISEKCIQNHKSGWLANRPRNKSRTTQIWRKSVNHSVVIMGTSCYRIKRFNKCDNSNLFVQALLKYISQVHQGVRGVIRDMSTHQPIRTTGLKIEGRDSYFRTTSRGEFWRILLPGTYKLQVRSISALAQLWHGVYLMHIWHSCDCALW